MKKLVLALTLCLALCFAGCSTETEQTDASAGILSQFSTQDLDGETVDQDILEDYEVTMVNVWATYCSPCIQEMPDLGELSEEYDDEGVQIIGLVSDVLASDGTVDSEQLALAQEIVNTTSAYYTHIVPSTDLYPLLSQITSVPTTFFVDENGKQVGSAYLGAKDKEDWEAILDQILAEVDA